MPTRASEQKPLPSHRLREIAVAAEVDPRSVAKFLRGQFTQEMVRSRIERALRARGLDALIQPERGR